MVTRLDRCFTFGATSHHLPQNALQYGQCMAQREKLRTALTSPLVATQQNEGDRLEKSA